MTTSKSISPFLTVSARSSNPTISAPAVANPATGNLTLDLTGYEGSDVTACYFVEDDCVAGNVSATAQCTVSIPCLQPTATIVCDDTDPANVMITVTGTPSTGFVGGIPAQNFTLTSGTLTLKDAASNPVTMDVGGGAFSMPTVLSIGECNTRCALVDCAMRSTTT